MKREERREKGQGTVSGLLLAVILSAAPAVAGQATHAESGTVRAAGQEAASQPSEAEPAHEEEHEGHWTVEADLVGSDVFQSGMLALRLGSPLLLDTHFFGVETNEIGVAGLAWEFRYKGLRVMPGLGWAFGSENRPAPVVTARWSFEHEDWISQGVWVLSLRAHVPPHGGEHGHAESGEENVRHSSVLDGAHISRRVGRLELGPMIEKIRYREEEEWKGGGRAAWELGRGVKIVSQVVAPDTEFRIGLAWEP